MGGVPRSGLVLRKIILKPSVWKMNWIILFFLNGIRLKFELGWAGVLFFGAGACPQMHKTLVFFSTGEKLVLEDWLCLTQKKKIGYTN